MKINVSTPLVVLIGIARKLSNLTTVTALIVKELHHRNKLQHYKEDENPHYEIKLIHAANLFFIWLDVTQQLDKGCWDTMYGTLLKKTGVKKGRFSKLVNFECLMIYQTVSPHDSLRVKAYLINISIKLKV